LGAAPAILDVAAAAPTILRGETTSTTGYMQTSKIIGMKVKTAQGEEVGIVKDVVINRSTGCMATPFYRPVGRYQDSTGYHGFLLQQQRLDNVRRSSWCRRHFRHWH